MSDLPRPDAGSASVIALPLAVTMGDPAGIGIEITLAAWLSRIERQLQPFAVFGCARTIIWTAGVLGLDVPVQRIGSISETRQVFSNALPVVDIPAEQPVQFGQPSSSNAAAVIASIEQATALAARGTAGAIVTNPIAKHVLYDAGFRYPGHTEYLGALAALQNPRQTYTPVMMLCSDELRVVPLTVHVPLAAVPALINPPLILATCRILNQSLIRDFGVLRPRIAIAGLNPHAGERGSIGTEDETAVRPAIERLRQEGVRVTGPHSADTLFHAAARRTYDAVVAMYHDQALIPIKTLAFDRGVNVTLGLPFVRTSPDHGTAFDIAGQGVASTESLVQAIKLAGIMAQRRADAVTAT